jgi:hypothetical protein
MLAGPNTDALRYLTLGAFFAGWRPWASLRQLPLLYGYCDQPHQQPA